MAICTHNTFPIVEADVLDTAAHLLAMDMTAMQAMDTCKWISHSDGKFGVYTV